MSASIPFVRGSNSTFKVYFNNRPLYLPCKVWNVDESATEHADGVNGEDRDRLDKTTNFFDTQLELFQSDMTVMQSYLDAIAADDAQGLPTVQTCALRLKLRDGTSANFILKECKVGPMKLASSGRADPIMLSLKVRSRYFVPVPSI